MKRGSSSESSNTEWVRVSVQTSEEAADAISNFLMEMGASGTAIEERDGTLRCIAYYPADEIIVDRLIKLKGLFDQLAENGIDPSPARVETDTIAEENWSEQWREHFKASRVGRHIVISPSWIDPELEENDILIVLDPGMAFGTGQHSSTRLALSLLEMIPLVGKRVIDIGTGSGILSLFAAKSGADLVTAIDNDPKVIPVARDNALANGVFDKIEFQHTTLPELSPFILYDVAVCNILAHVNIALLPDIRARLVPDGTAVFSGILAEEEDEMREQCETHGFEVSRVEKEDIWVGMIARKTHRV